MGLRATGVRSERNTQALASLIRSPMVGALGMVLSRVLGGSG